VYSPIAVISLVHVFFVLFSAQSVAKEGVYQGAYAGVYRSAGKQTSIVTIFLRTGCQLGKENQPLYIKANLVSRHLFCTSDQLDMKHTKLRQLNHQLDPRHPQTRQAHNIYHRILIARFL
jgi:hypothetical protein